MFIHSKKGNAAIGGQIQAYEIFGKHASPFKFILLLRS